MLTRWSSFSDHIFQCFILLTNVSKKARVIGEQECVLKKKKEKKGYLKIYLPILINSPIKKVICDKYNQEKSLGYVET